MEKFYAVSRKSLINPDRRAYIKGSDVIWESHLPVLHTLEEADLLIMQHRKGLTRYFTDVDLEGIQNRYDFQIEEFVLTNPRFSEPVAETVPGEYTRLQLLEDISPKDEEE